MIPIPGTRVKKMRQQNNQIHYIVDYCPYCKDPVYSDEDYEPEGESYYHKFCFKQKNTYVDGFDE